MRNLVASINRWFRPVVFLWVLCLVVWLAACNPSATIQTTSTSRELTATVVQSPTPLPPTPLPATSTPTQAPTSIPQQSLYLASYLPTAFREQIGFPENVTPTESNLADYFLEIWDAPALSRWIYALVAPFPTVQDGVTAEDLRKAWAGETGKSSIGLPLLMDQSTQAIFSTWWGQPTEGVVQVMPADELLDYAWEHPQSWAIIPFEALEPKWKVLQIDGISPLQKEFDPERYVLTVPFGILDKDSIPLESLPQGWSLPATNRDPGKLTTVAMTGVTALVRGTALWMERYGITYPAEDIGPILRSADLTHISNEIPFVPDCPYPTIPTPAPEGAPEQTITFCSNPDYIALLEEVGTDIVELTGDHFADWGDQAMQYTLDMYAERGWPVYGGGLNAEQARQPLLLERNGNKLAFIGCNIGWPVRKDQIPLSALATDDHPGAAQCDFEWLSTEIPSLRAEGYNVIFTFQHREYDRMKAEPILVHDFGQIASYGATIVSGSQAHQPHNMAFENGAFIHYGLGNLFFDQYHYCQNYGCDNAFIDIHVFYDNHYISTELIPIRFVDLAKPRLMTPEERAKFLEAIFQASGWGTGN
jgi:hypothetical protein